MHLASPGGRTPDTALRAAPQQAGGVARTDVSPWAPRRVATRLASAAGLAAALAALLPAAANAADYHVNFQPKKAVVPSGYVRDFGEAYGPRTLADQGSGLSYGWVSAGTSNPLALTSWTRERNRAGIDPRLDTLMHVQPNGSEAAWEIEVPAGQYHVTVSVGDAPTDAGVYDSNHTINVEG